MKTLPGFKSFCGHAPSGPTYTDLAREVERLKADNAAFLGGLRALLFSLEDAERRGPVEIAPGLALKALVSQPHPGSGLLDELENLRKQVEALKAGQRNASEARQRAFLELAEDLAAMTPEKRDAAIKRIIDNSGENRT